MRINDNFDVKSKIYLQSIKSRCGVTDGMPSYFFKSRQVIVLEKGSEMSVEESKKTNLVDVEEVDELFLIELVVEPNLFV